MQTEVIYMTDRQYSVISNISIISTNVRCNVTFSATAFVHDVIQPLVRHHLSMLYIMQTHCQTPPHNSLNGNVKWLSVPQHSSTILQYYKKTFRQTLFVHVVHMQMHHQTSSPPTHSPFRCSPFLKDESVVTYDCYPLSRVNHGECKICRTARLSPVKMFIILRKYKK